MAAITVRNLDDDVRDRLRLMAAEHGHSMEAEVRSILTAAAGRRQQRPNALMELYWAGRGDVVVEMESDLVPPRRQSDPPRVDFTDQTFG